MTRLAVGLLRADLDTLDACVAALARTEAELATLSDDLSRRLVPLHEEWRGEAALAHAHAQRRWDASVERLQEALATLRAAVRHAHGSYAAAVGANGAMWSQLS